MVSLARCNAAHGRLSSPACQLLVEYQPLGGRGRGREGERERGRERGRERREPVESSADSVDRSEKDGENESKR